MRPMPRATAALAASILLVGAFALLATGRATGSDPFEATGAGDPFAGAAATAPEPEKHWAEDHLRSFDAESSSEKSIYLAAVQLVELERERGDVTAAIPTLRDIATRAGRQQLRNAINRLLFEIAREQDDHDDAREHLHTIIEESLGQT